MTIELHSESLSGRRTLVRASGEVDLATAPDLAAALDDARASGLDVVLDLAGVTFIDTSGVRAMLDARRRINDDGSDLTVVAPPDSPSRRLLELTELVESLSVVDSVDDVPAAGA